MSKTNFESRIKISTEFLNGIKQIFFDGQEEDWHFEPININDTDSTFVDLYVTRDTEQEILAPKVFHNSLENKIPSSPIGEEDRYRFTDKVVGAYPLQDSHLTTKEYVDETLESSINSTPLSNMGSGIEIYKPSGEISHSFLTLNSRNLISIEEEENSVRIDFNKTIDNFPGEGEKIFENPFLFKTITGEGGLYTSNNGNEIILRGDYLEKLFAGDNVSLEGFQINSQLQLTENSTLGESLITDSYLGELKRLKTSSNIEVISTNDEIHLEVINKETEIKNNFVPGEDIYFTNGTTINSNLSLGEYFSIQGISIVEEGIIKKLKADGQIKVSEDLLINLYKLSSNNFETGNDIFISESNNNLFIDSDIGDFCGLQEGPGISLRKTETGIEISRDITKDLDFIAGDQIKIQENYGRYRIDSLASLENAESAGIGLVNNNSLKRLVEGWNTSFSMDGGTITIHSSASPSIEDFMGGFGINIEKTNDKIEIKSFREIETSGGPGISFLTNEELPKTKKIIEGNNTIFTSNNDSITIDVIGENYLTFQDFIEGGNINLVYSNGNIEINQTQEDFDITSYFLEGNNTFFETQGNQLKISSFHIIPGLNLSSSINNVDKRITIDSDLLDKNSFNEESSVNVSFENSPDGVILNLENFIDVSNFDEANSTNISYSENGDRIRLVFEDPPEVLDFEGGDGISITDSNGKVEISSTIDLSLQPNQFVEGTNISITNEVGGVQIASYDIAGGNKISSSVDDINNSVTLDFDGLTAADFEAGNGISITDSNGKVNIESILDISISASDFVEGTNISITDEVGGAQIASYDIVGGNKISFSVDDINNSVTLDFDGLTAADFETGNGISITDSNGKVNIESSLDTSISSNDFVEGTNISITNEVGGVQIASYDIVGRDKISSVIDNTNNNVTLDFDGLTAADFEAGNGISITDSNGKVNIESSLDTSISTSDFVEGTNISITDEVGGVQIALYDIVGGNKISSVIDNTNKNVTLDFDGLTAADFEAGNGISITDSNGKVNIESSLDISISASDFVEGTNISITDEVGGVQIASYDIVGRDKISSVVDNTNNNVTLDFDGLTAADFEAGNGISITDSNGKVKLEVLESPLSSSEFTSGTNISISDTLEDKVKISYPIGPGWNNLYEDWMESRKTLSFLVSKDEFDSSISSTSTFLYYFRTDGDDDEAIIEIDGVNQLRRRHLGNSGIRYDNGKVLLLTDSNQILFGYVDGILRSKANSYFGNYWGGPFHVGGNAADFEISKKENNVIYVMTFTTAPSGYTTNENVFSLTKYRYTKDSMTQIWTKDNTHLIIESPIVITEEEGEEIIYVIRSKGSVDYAKKITGYRSDGTIFREYEPPNDYDTIIDFDISSANDIIARIIRNDGGGYQFVVFSEGTPSPVEILGYVTFSDLDYLVWKLSREDYFIRIYSTVTYGRQMDIVKNPGESLDLAISSNDNKITALPRNPVGVSYDYTRGLVTDVRNSDIYTIFSQPKNMNLKRYDIGPFGNAGDEWRRVFPFYSYPRDYSRRSY